MHGLCSLPEGYQLAIVPPGSLVYEISRPQLESPPPQDRGNQNDDGNLASIKINSSSNYAKNLIAVFQTVYASLTLYQARGDQIQRYGFTAFGFTVTPYLVMSIVNLLSTILNPSYSTTYMVQSTMMDEAVQRGGYFEGMVGRVEDSDAEYHTKNPKATFQFQDNTPHVLQFGENHRDTATAAISSVSSSTGGSGDNAHINDTSEEVKEFDILGYIWLTEYFRRIGKRRPAKRLEEDEVILLIPSSPSLKSMGKTVEGLESSSAWVAWEGSFVSCIAIAIVAGLSRLKTGQSSSWQIIRTAAYYACGVSLGPMLRLDRPFAIPRYLVVNGVVWSVPIILTFVAVGQMLREYGNCVEID